MYFHKDGSFALLGNGRVIEVHILQVKADVLADIDQASRYLHMFILYVMKAHNLGNYTTDQTSKNSIPFYFIRLLLDIIYIQELCMRSRRRHLLPQFYCFVRR